MATTRNCPTVQRPQLTEHRSRENCNNFLAISCVGLLRVSLPAPASSRARACRQLLEGSASARRRDRRGRVRPYPYKRIPSRHPLPGSNAAAPHGHGGRVRDWCVRSRARAAGPPRRCRPPSAPTPGCDHPCQPLARRPLRNSCRSSWLGSRRLGLAQQWAPSPLPAAAANTCRVTLRRQAPQTTAPWRERRRTRGSSRAKRVRRLLPRQFQESHENSRRPSKRI